MPLFAVLLLSSTPLLAQTPWLEENTPWANSPWGLMSRQMFVEAQAEFQKTPLTSSIHRLGYALSLLTGSAGDFRSQREAREILRSLAFSPSGGEIAALARFFLICLSENENAPPGQISNSYRLLLEERTANPLMEMAASRLALLEIHRAGTDRDRQNEVLDELQKLESYILTPPARREFYTSIAFALLENEGEPQIALDYLLKADAIGHPLPQTQADTLLLIAGLAQHLKKNDLALDYYRRFLTSIRRDNRRYEIEQIVHKLEAGKNEG